MPVPGVRQGQLLEGCNADVVTLALEHDISLIEKPDLLTAAGSRNMTMIPHHTLQQWSFL